MARILIIDDDPTFTAILAKQLGMLEHESESATTLEEGIDLAETLAPDVVFLDVNLPDGSGLSAIKTIKAKPSSPEVIIVTGEGESGGAAMAISHGAWDYIQKGHSIQDIILPVNHALLFRHERLSRSRAKAMNLCGIVGKSQEVVECLDQVAQAADDDSTNVLITGETGTGKELFARAIHKNSARSAKPFIIVDCASLPDNLVESVLLGHKKGAFTGAEFDHEGLIRQAHGGTLFLDEVGELPQTVQKSFLRVLQEKRFRPIGAKEEVSSEFRLIAATNRDLDQMVADAKFRKDLYYRLKVHHITLPSLRERSGDVTEIAKEQIARICERNSMALKGVSPEFFELLKKYTWPGNVRELINSLERAISTGAEYPTLHPFHLPTNIRAEIASSSIRNELNTQVAGPPPAFTLKDAKKAAEKTYLLDVMASSAGDMDRACEISGISRSSLYGLLKEHGIERN
jgi:two-component system NtrC family response regulator